MSTETLARPLMLKAILADIGARFTKLEQAQAAVAKGSTEAQIQIAELRREIDALYDEAAEAERE
jgi:hypothetical protein